MRNETAYWNTVWVAGVHAALYTVLIFAAALVHHRGWPIAFIVLSQAFAYAGVVLRSAREARDRRLEDNGALSPFEFGEMVSVAASLACAFMAGLSLLIEW